jgi:hypothetical protein
MEIRILKLQEQTTLSYYVGVDRAQRGDLPCNIRDEHVVRVPRSMKLSLIAIRFPFNLSDRNRYEKLISARHEAIKGMAELTDDRSPL